MDPVINSLVQSPLVRSMSTVPSKASSFVHGVRDNVPPFSFQKVVVKPWNNPSKTTQDATHKFRIPQYGTLNRAYLRIKTKNPTPTSPPSVTEGDYSGLYVVSSDAVPTDSNYTAMNNNMRIPWIHPSQLNVTVKKRVPMGGGGAGMVHHTNITNPTDGTNGWGADESQASKLLCLDDASFEPKSSNAWNVINILDEMRLTTNGKLVETVYGETIPAEVVKMPEGLRDFYVRGMLGWASGDRQTAAFVEEHSGFAWDPTAASRDARGVLTNSVVQTRQDAICRNQHAQFCVPVTLSSLKMLNKNYQTRFVEDLELEVKMKSLGRGFDKYSPSDSIAYHDLELVLIYHNWHDNIENTIRNSNYKRGVPASVYSTNWVRAATTAKVVSGNATLSIPITSRNLATEILVVAKSKSAGNNTFSTIETLKRLKSDYVVNLEGEFHYDLELTGSGKTIWSGKSKELLGPDSADYDLSERRLMGGDCAYGGIRKKGVSPHKGGFGVYDSTYTISGAISTLGPNTVSQGSVDYSFGDNMAIMRFGFQSTDEFYSGGIALQTISNPTIHITPPASTGLSNSWTDMEIEFDVYVKHANLVRIDSDTGAVSRTLDV